MAIEHKNTKTKRDYKPRDLLNKQELNHSLNHPFLHQEINLNTDSATQNLSQADLSSHLPNNLSAQNLFKKNKFYFLFSFLILISFLLTYLHHHQETKNLNQNLASAQTQLINIPLAVNLKTSQPV